MTEFEIQKSLRQLTASYAGIKNAGKIVISSLPQAGSDRRYYRISCGDMSFIGTYTPDPSEGRCFCQLAQDFHNAGCAVPAVYACSPDCRLYIQEDLGDVSLFSKISEVNVEDLVRQTLFNLVCLQSVPSDIWESDCMSRPFSRRQVMWDLNYFKYEFVKPAGIVFDEECLEDDFNRFADELMAMPEKFCGFMMRDCQSRNVMISRDVPKFIDFQGGRRGPVLYDAVSLLWQARAGFPADFRMRMLDYYADTFCKGNESLKEQLLSYWPDIVLLRTLQVLGAYGFRGLVEHRSHFILSIPGAISNLAESLNRGDLDRFPELKRLCGSLTSKETFRAPDIQSSLRVEVFSFSYKKGYPFDSSGNGGGFMFDCRAMHNPGRYEEYKRLTGRDLPVKDFLERRGEVQSFLKSAWAMTDPAVERYISRGFSNLQIGFGCTGGQHRSVYCAEATARHIMDTFPEANVRLIHREHPDNTKEV